MKVFRNGKPEPSEKNLVEQARRQVKAGQRQLRKQLAEHDKQTSSSILNSSTR